MTQLSSCQCRSWTTCCGRGTDARVRCVR
jgi:hypothetical protein